MAVFNLLGPILNPLKLDAQLVGVAQSHIGDLYIRILKASGIRQAAVCHSLDGMDEIAASADTKLLILKRLMHVSLNMGSCHQVLILN